MPKEIKNVVKSFRHLLKILKPYVKDFELMLRTKKFPGSSLSAIEMWGNWLICAVIRRYISGDITFADDEEGDGIIFDKRDGSTRQTEHVSATNNPSSHESLASGEQRIINAINKKISKGPNYAAGNILIAFFDGAGEWYRNKVREAINGRHNFYKIYLIGLLTRDSSGYAYSVTELHENDSITFKVQINHNFTHWSVTKI